VPVDELASIAPARPKSIEQTSLSHSGTGSGRMAFSFPSCGTCTTKKVFLTATTYVNSNILVLVVVPFNLIIIDWGQCNQVWRDIQTPQPYYNFEYTSDPNI
jgi:hypothetical protein